MISAGTFRQLYIHIYIYKIMFLEITLMKDG